MKQRVGMFGLLVLIVLITILISPVSVNEDIYIYQLLGQSKEMLLQEVCYANIIMVNVFKSTWLVMFAPMLAAIPFISHFTTMQESGFWRLCLFRASKRKSYIGYYSKGVLQSGCVFLTAYLIYAAIVMIHFPSLQEYGMNEQESNSVLMMLHLQDGILGNSLKKAPLAVTFLLGVAESFSYGCFVSVLPVVLTAYLKNRYILLSLPVIIKFMIDRMFVKCSESSFWQNVIGYIDVEQGRNCLSSFRQFAVWCMVQMGWVIAGLCIFYYGMGRRADSGQSV